jgi:hypothetical protein
MLAPAFQSVTSDFRLGYLNLKFRRWCLVKCYVKTVLVQNVKYWLLFQTFNTIIVLWLLYKFGTATAMFLNWLELNYITDFQQLRSVVGYMMSIFFSFQLWHWLLLIKRFPYVGTNRNCWVANVAIVLRKHNGSSIHSQFFSCFPNGVHFLHLFHVFKGLNKNS